MYKSPINTVYGELETKLKQTFDETVVSAVQSVGVNVDKDELVKALHYDREQYEKGYRDGRAMSAFEKESVSESLENLYRICSVHTNAMAIVERKCYLEELTIELFGDDPKEWPSWIQWELNRYE